MSKALTKNLPALESECLIYIVEMKLVKPISEENNPKKRRIIDPFETNYAFGFLSSRELPTVLFTTMIDTRHIFKLLLEFRSPDSLSFNDRAK